MQHALLLIVIAALLLPGVPGGAAYAETGGPQPIFTYAEAAALIDVSTGRLLHSYQGDKRMRIASLTKVMTAIVAIEHGDVSDLVKVSANAYGKEGSSIYLRLGEEMSLLHMLYGLMLRSGNDAATAIAEHVGGSVEGFAFLMNEKAKLIGMDNTQFMNPHGLDEEGHYSTANDLAKLTAYALKNPIFQEIVRTKIKKVPNPYENWDHTWLNKNRMLSMYEGADGGKTGYTKLAGRCLISSATRNGQQLAVVTLNDGNDWLDHRRLLDYGFQNYPLKTLLEKGHQVEDTGLVAGRSFKYPLHESEQSGVNWAVEAHAPESVEYRFGELARVTVHVDGSPVGSIPLYEPDSPLLRQPNQPSKTTGGGFGAGSRAGELAAVVKRAIRSLFEF